MTEILSPWYSHVTFRSRGLCVAYTFPSRRAICTCLHFSVKIGSLGSRNYSLYLLRAIIDATVSVIGLLRRRIFKNTQVLHEKIASWPLVWLWTEDVVESPLGKIFLLVERPVLQFIISYLTLRAFHCQLLNSLTSALSRTKEKVYATKNQMPSISLK